MRRALCFVLAAAAIVATFGDAASARRRSAPTTIGPITWDESDDGDEIVLVEGTLSSTKSKCLAGRNVEISAGESATLQTRFGSGTTDSSGHFRISGVTPDESYYSIFVTKSTAGSLRCRSSAAYGQFDFEGP
jgi:hypothetical protein